MLFDGLKCTCNVPCKLNRNNFEAFKCRREKKKLKMARYQTRGSSEAVAKVTPNYSNKKNNYNNDNNNLEALASST